MSATLNAKLDAIFNARAEKKAEAKRVKLESEKREEENLQAFQVLQASVIRPTLESLANNLTDRGLESVVFECAGEKSKRPEALGVGTGIKFYRLKLLKSVSSAVVPYLTLELDKDVGHVKFRFDTSTQGKSGESGTSIVVDLKSVTRDLIHDEALKVIAMICK